MNSDKNLIFADIVYFDLIYPSEKKRENSKWGQKMSAKVCQRFLYSLPTLTDKTFYCLRLYFNIFVEPKPNSFH